MKIKYLLIINLIYFLNMTFQYLKYIFINYIIYFIIIISSRINIIYFLIN